LTTQSVAQVLNRLTFKRIANNNFKMARL